MFKSIFCKNTLNCVYLKTFINLLYTMGNGSGKPMDANDEGHRRSGHRRSGHRRSGHRRSGHMHRHSKRMHRHSMHRHSKHMHRRCGHMHRRSRHKTRRFRGAGSPLNPNKTASSVKKKRKVTVNKSSPLNQVERIMKRNVAKARTQAAIKEEQERRMRIANRKQPVNVNSSSSSSSSSDDNTDYSALYKKRI